MPNLLKNLNDKQKQAVTAPLGPVLVLAGAGSGKTRVLTYRIAYLLQEEMFQPQDLLALTFTNKAAGEMKQRIATLLGISETELGLTMGTFHSVCSRFLRQDIEQLGEGYTRNYVIYDSEDSLGVVKQAVIEFGYQDQWRPQVFTYYISAAKNQMIQPNKLAIENESLRTALQKVYKYYQERLQASNALDFDDLLGLFVQLLEQPELLKKYQERFKYVLVDEYQDTNHVQYVLLKKLVAKHKSLFVVGDDAQSIYGFRGANMQNILDFKKDYKKAKVVTLEQNYRSTQPILSVAEKVIGMNEFQYEKKLWTANKSSELVRVYAAPDDQSEGDFVVSSILGEVSFGAGDWDGEFNDDVDDGGFSDEADQNSNLGSGSILEKFMSRKDKWRARRRPRLRGDELPEELSETAILYRTHAQSRVFEEALLSAGIPYQIIGGIKFYERKEIKDTLAYLRLVLNPRDLVSIARVINLPARGIGPKSLKLAIKGLQKYKFDFTKCRLNLNAFGLTARAEEGLDKFFDLYERARELPKKEPVSELMELLLVRSGYKESLLDGSEEGQSRWENIEQLFNVAAKFDNLPWREGLEQFLEEIALMTDLDRADDDPNQLTLMTLHSAKGLEFNRVYFVGLEEGILPHSRSLNSPEELAEEIRLAYVGVTRARKELYLSYARQRLIYGELKKSLPSRIFKSIPKKLLKDL